LPVLELRCPDGCNTGVVSALLAAAALVAPSGATCPATTVRHQLAKNPGYSDAPWVLARPTAPGVLASLPDYPQSLRDARVNRSDGLVLWTAGARMVWNAPGSVVARRLDRPGRFRAAPALVFPAPGCWRLTRGAGARAVSVVARVVPVPQTLGCAATVLEGGDAYARPRSSGIRGGWPWQESGPARLTTHGHDGDRNMKVPWWISRGGPSLTLVGTRLDGAGLFRQEFPMAGSPTGVYPSIVDIPAAGCWLLRLRTARLAGVLVVRALDAHG
jgi:hypothetical protein